MSLSAINPLATSSSATSTDSTMGVTAKTTLSQQDFLNLLMAQMTNQDPMNPMSDEQFIGTMAQFTTLQQTKEMSSNVAQLSAQNTLGTTVSLQNSDGSVTTGTVSAIQNINGTPEMTVNGQHFTMDQLLSIALPNTQTSGN